MHAAPARLTLINNLAGAQAASCRGGMAWWTPARWRCRAARRRCSGWCSGCWRATRPLGQPRTTCSYRHGITAQSIPALATLLVTSHYLVCWRTRNICVIGDHFCLKNQC